MRTRCMIWFAAAFMTSFFTPTGTASQPVSGVDAENAYPETADGLKALLAELMAPRAEDVRKIESLYATLTIPDHKQWFEKTFGSEEGARLEAKYSASLQEFSARPKFVLQNAARQGKTVVNVRLYPTPDEPPLVQAFLAAMTAPTTLYHATGAVDPDDKRVMLLGNFVYVDGGFRYVDFKLMEALSTAPAIRLRLGGNVAAPKLLNRIEPEYPQQARAAGIQGTVKLHAIIGKDGTVREIEVVSGDRVLVDAAVEAVKKWRYQPTLLNGQTIEVDTVIEVVFQLKK